MKLAILSREPNSYSTRRLVEATEKRGDEALVLDYSKCYMEIEPSKPAVYIKGHKIEGVGAVVPRLAPAYTSYLSSVVRQFEMMRVYSSVSSLAVVRAGDKLRSMQLLARSGVGIPKTVFARRSDDTGDLIELVGGSPVVVKVLEGNQGIGVVLAETKTSARSVIEGFYGLGANILVQEYIEEANGEDIRIVVVGDRVVGAMLRKGEEGEFRSNLHRGGKSYPVELTKKEENMAIKATRTLGLNYAGVDIVRSKRGPLVIEVNPSPGIEGVERLTGENVAGVIIDYIAQKAFGKPRKDRIGA